MRMKFLMFAVVSLFLSMLSFSQETERGKKDNLLFLLRQTEHINQALKTVQRLQSGTEMSLNTGKVKIIVCGEAVTALTTKQGEEWVKKIADHPNISLVACGLSLAKFNKTKEDLAPGVEYAENGFIRAFELQKQGYLSVEL